ncbi:hypothetical protein ROTO_29110 [Roseovarius tolerans]|uniref:Lipoprotein n=1 Tax=Roseovarius tolerans TaxID=74031 RepID=A0A0L6CS29_9RHOB|nr:hypothetical protein [Roseovarius tolerans]KNX40569.1 hypothetical protein ROTO_29110 [Roseovarius tolerans]
MIRVALFTLLCALTGPALALTCLPPDVARTYQQAAEAEEAYIVVHARLEFDADALPRTDWQDQAASPPHTLIPARMTGHALTKTGFDLRFDRAITLDAQCFGPWCAGAIPGTSYLAFLQRTQDGYLLALDPCGGMGFADPTPETLRRVETCYSGGRCDPQSP